MLWDMRRIWIFITVMGFCLSVYAGGKVEDRGLYVSYDPAYGELAALVSWMYIVVPVEANLRS